MNNQNNWALFDVRNGGPGLDYMFKPNYVFDPIPSPFLRHSGYSAATNTYTAGGRGALRKWWGWAQCEQNSSWTQYLDDAWSFPQAPHAGRPEPVLRNASLVPNVTEVISDIHTPRAPHFNNLACYAETITAYFRPKRTARYQFKLWGDDEYWSRLYFNPNGIFLIVRILIPKI